MQKNRVVQRIVGQPLIFRSCELFLGPRYPKNRSILGVCEDYVEWQRKEGIISDEAARNRTLLLEVMNSVGLRPYAKEWWHYQERVSMPRTREIYPLLDF